MKIQNWNCEKGMQIRKYEQAAGGQHVGRTKRWKQKDSFYHKSEILWRLVLFVVPHKWSSFKAQVSIWLRSLEWTYSTCFRLPFSSPQNTDNMWKLPAGEAPYSSCSGFVHLYLRSGQAQTYRYVLPSQRGAHCPNTGWYFILRKGKNVTGKIRSYHLWLTDKCL